MTGITVYGDYHRSLHTKTVMLALEEKDLPYQLVRRPVVGFVDGDLDLGFDLGEITRHIALRYSEMGNRLIPVDVDLTRFTTVMRRVDDYFSEYAETLVKELVYRPIANRRINPPVLSEADAALADTLSEIAVTSDSARLAEILDRYQVKLETSSFLYSEDFTLIDLLHIPAIDYLLITSPDLFASRLKVFDWARRIVNRPSFLRVLRRCGSSSFHRFLV